MSSFGNLHNFSSNSVSLSASNQTTINSISNPPAGTYLAIGSVSVNANGGNTNVRAFVSATDEATIVGSVGTDINWAMAANTWGTSQSPMSVIEVTGECIIRLTASANPAKATAGGHGLVLVRIA